MQAICWSLSLVALTTLVAACGDDSAAGSSGSRGGEPSVEITAAAREEARTLYTSLCSTCHGVEGRGDGPGASAQLKPRTFTDAAWQQSVTDEHIAKVITLGGAAVGLNPAMPAQPQLKSKPQVLAALVEMVRGFGE